MKSGGVRHGGLACCDVPDFRPRRPGAQTRVELVELLKTSVRVRLHISVRQVADPAGEADFLRGALRKGAEANTLHAARNHVQASGFAAGPVGAGFLGIVPKHLSHAMIRPNGTIWSIIARARIGGDGHASAGTWISAGVRSRRSDRRFHASSPT